MKNKKPKNNPKKELEKLISQSKVDEKNLELTKLKEKKHEYYQGDSHYDKNGNFDHISEEEFTLKQHFKVSKKSITFRITLTAIVLALAIAVSGIDMLLEKFSINIGGVHLDMRILDLMVIILGIPVVGLLGSIFIGIVEPWFHFLIDGDHLPVQIALDSVGYVLTVVVIFFIYYIAFKNSPIHKEPNKTKHWLKTIFPGLVIVPILALIFTGIFLLSLAFGFDLHHDNSSIVINYLSLFFISFGIQLARFLLMYILFVVIENKLKPINHRYL